MMVSNAKKNAREELRQQRAAAAARKRRNRAIGVGAIIVVVLAAIVTTVVLVATNKAAPTAAQTTGVPPHANSDHTGIIVNPGKASASAPVVAIYLDYQCPICHELETTYGSSFESLANSGGIQLEYHTMTFIDQNAKNDSSENAAIGAACADIQGVYSAYHDQVFANQPTQEGAGYSQTLLRDTIPTTIGLTGSKLAAFQQCYDTQATKAFVDNVAAQALASGVTGTPTIKVNGKQLAVSQLGDPSNLQNVINTAAES